MGSTFLVTTATLNYLHLHLLWTISSQNELTNNECLFLNRDFATFATVCSIVSLLKSKYIWCCCCESTAWCFPKFIKSIKRRALSLHYEIQEYLTNICRILCKQSFKKRRLVSSAKMNMELSFLYSTLNLCERLFGETRYALPDRRREHWSGNWELQIFLPLQQGSLNYRWRDTANESHK